jgi:heparosan-N-sulfate-glucuronate 5-epimerase
VGWRNFELPQGTQIAPGRLRGYYIDFRVKAETPSWPPPWFPWPGFHRYMAIAQWGLGCYERYLSGEGDSWLAGAVEAADHLIGQQESSRASEGAWLEPVRPHTFPVAPPWASAMAQGQCASLLVRVHAETGKDALLEAANRALIPFKRSTAEGGVLARLDGRPFPEEYPTQPPSFVLNGAIFALWGVYDVQIALRSADASDMYRDIVEMLASNLDRWDTGYWSRYDLFPHRLIAVASWFYHYLHIHQLNALHAITRRDEFRSVAERFSSYASSPTSRARALAHKAFFRILIPKRRPRRVAPAR